MFSTVFYVPTVFLFEKWIDIVTTGKLEINKCYK